MVPLGIDKEKLNIQLSRFEEHIVELAGIGQKITVQNDDSLRVTERVLHLAVEDCLNIGNHIISGKGFRRADTYKEIFIILQEEKIITPDLTKKMVSLTSLRNRLVHLYWKVTNEEVMAALKELDTFRQFAKEITVSLKI